METMTINNPTRKTQTTFEKLGEIWGMTRAICHFVPVICSLVWILYYTLNPSNFVADYILFPLVMIGWIAALIACPLQFIKVAFKLVVGGWTVGWTICPLIPMCFGTALAGAAIGLFAAIVLVVFAPAAITIYNFFKD